MFEWASVPSPDVSSLVPYTGATRSLDMGSYGITANTYYGDGSNLTGIPSTTPAGNNTEIQFNDNGVFGASPLFTYGTGGLYVGNNVGIGVASPSEKLEIAGNVVVSNNSGFGWGGRTTRIDGSDYSTNDYMQFIVNNGSAMYINSSGNVGID